MRFLSFLSAVSLLAQTTFAASKQSASFYYGSKSEPFKVESKLDTKSDVYGVKKNSMDENGWITLEIATQHDSPYTSEQLFFAVGYIEGYLTFNEVTQAYKNILSWDELEYALFDNRVSSKLKSWFAKNELYSRAQVKVNPDDKFWQGVGNIWHQFDGLVEGVNSQLKQAGRKKLPRFAFHIMNAMGDLLDLLKVIEMEEKEEWWINLSSEEFKRRVQKRSLCSALVRVTPGLEHVYMAHSTWFIYQMMLRVYKTYHIHTDQTSNQNIQFSSYPGILSSLDDFYMMKDTQLVMIQTTNNIFNTSLYSHVTPRKQLAWVRVRVANSLARNGSEWGSLVSRENSGTYNNQYMVIDLKRISLKNELKDWTLTVVEQIPGLVRYADQSRILETGFWSSYNVPFYEEIYDLSGYPAIVERYGSDYCYQMAPRAKIFRRDAPKVMSMREMKKLMRYNEYQTDPYSEDNPCDSICCRADLKTDSPSLSGCYDSKVTSYEDFFSGQKAHIASGPTRYGDIPAFSWKEWEHMGYSHLGQPEIFNFDYIEYKPSLE